MRCSACDTPLPEGAAFCVECGAPAPGAASTGRTVALGQRPEAPAGPAEGPQLPAPTAQPPAQTSAPRGRRRRSLFDGSWRPLASGLNARSGAIFLIGLGLLFFFDAFWPWILALVGVTGAIEELSDGKGREGLATLLLLVGLAVLFATGAFWPGILILIGLVALLDRVG